MILPIKAIQYQALLVVAAAHWGVLHYFQTHELAVRGNSFASGTGKVATVTLLRMQSQQPAPGTDAAVVYPASSKSVPHEPATYPDAAIPDSATTVQLATGARTGSTAPRPGDAEDTIIPGIRRTYYFLASELTARPVVIQDIPENFALDLPGIQTGSLTLRLMVNASGKVDKVIVVDSMLTDEAEKLLVAAFQDIKFIPGKIADMAVATQLVIAVNLADMVTDPTPSR